MPLDIDQLAAQIDRQAGDLRAGFRDLDHNSDNAARAYRKVSLAPDGLAPQIERSHTATLLAQPLEPLGLVAPVPPAPDDYTVVATDSSTIAPDRHGGASLYHVINVGRVMLRYGAGADAMLDSKTHFFAGEVASEDRESIQNTVLDAKAALLELREAFEIGRATGAALVLKDGLLNLWNAAALRDSDGLKIRDNYYYTLNRFRDTRLPLVGYISRPNSDSVVNSLRLSLCGRPFAHCKRVDGDEGDKKMCHPDTAIACSAVRGVLDHGLFDRVLLPNHRSPAFKGIMKARRNMGAAPDDICFLYVNLAFEIVRLEFQEWLLPQIDSIAALVVDQYYRGADSGYPPAISEAHELAVLRTADRLTLRAILEERGLLTAESEKGRSKRLRSL